MKNCYIWAREQIKNSKGKMALAWSENWFLHFHVIYIKPDGSLWGYVPIDKSYITLWKFILNGEWLFEGHTVQYDGYISFWQGLYNKIFKN